MKIVFICPVYPPEIVPSAVMLAQSARHLAEKGHEVEVVTAFPSLPHGRVFPGFRRRLRRVTVEQGVRVIRCFSFVMGPDRKPLWRILSHLSFAVIACLRVIFGPRPDVLVVESFPVISSPLLVLCARLRGIPCANHVKDLYPECAVDAGLIDGAGVLRLLALALDRITCRTADVNVVLADSFKEILVETRRVPRGSIEVVRDWVDGSMLRPVGRENPWREETGLDADTFIALFAGNMGPASGVDVLVPTAEALRSRNADGIVLLCMGEGLLKGKMVEETKALGLDNLRFLPFQPEERLAEALSAADLFILTMSRDHRYSSVPSKLITYLAMARPIVCSAYPDTPVAREVEAANCGLVVGPGDPEALADAIMEAACNRRQWRERGARGRKRFLQRFEMKAALQRFEERVVGRLAACTPADRSGGTSHRPPKPSPMLGRRPRSARSAGLWGPLRSWWKLVVP